MHYAIHHIDKVASTNDLAFEVCAEKEPEEGTVYVAYEQTAGKGYHDNIWVMAVIQIKIMNWMMY